MGFRVQSLVLRASGFKALAKGLGLRGSNFSGNVWVSGGEHIPDKKGPAEGRLVSKGFDS